VVPGCDVGVEAEEVVRVIGGLHGRQAVVVGPVGVLDPATALVSEVVHGDAGLEEGAHRLEQGPGPGDVQRLGGIVPPREDQAVVLSRPVRERGEGRIDPAGDTGHLLQPDARVPQGACSIEPRMTSIAAVGSCLRKPALQKW
jgi:hypothetical protein